jgi:hypothetical protein
MEMVPLPVPANVVRLVVAWLLKATPAPVTKIEPPLNVILRSPVVRMLATKELQVSIFPFKSKNPFKVNVGPRVTVFVEIKASISCTPEPPGVAAIATGKLIATPLVVMDWPVGLLNVAVPVLLNTVPETTDQFPDTASVPVLENVTAPAETVKPKQAKLPVSVTV